MYKNILFAALIITLNLNAQVSVSLDSVNFSQILTGTTDSFFVYINNSSSLPASIKINSTKSVYSLSDSVLTIPSNDSIGVWIKYQPDQNVVDNDLLFISGDDSTIGSVIRLTGSGIYGDSYDATTFNLYDAQLKTALTQLVSGHTSLGYNLARDKMFMIIDNQKVNGRGAAQNTLECVYIGRLAVGYIDRTDAQNNYNFNTEHTWPQSNFSENEPMKSDLYHLYPTDNPANGIRSNYPFGKVVSNITWQVGGSKLGNNSLGQIVFEPRDIHKGDVSRSMFYFITRYPVNYGGFFTQVQENVFREWNKLDPVGVVESNRNGAIALVQLKRNPYIDHPEFADRIYSFVTNNSHPVFAELNVIPLKVNFDSTLITNSASQIIYIANNGSKQLVVDSITISDSRFSLSTNNYLLEPNSYLKSTLVFNPDSVKTYNAVLKVFSDAGIKKIAITGTGKDNAVNVDAEIITPLNFSLEQNYPNPFNPNTKISFKLAERSYIELKIFDVLGNEVATLVNEQKPTGYYEVNWDASSMGSGVYFYRLYAGSFVQTRKMILMK
jgi:hypothetical protein